MSLKSESDLEVSCMQLQHEQVILNKLIYRNRNQHRKAKHFCDMVKISKSLHFVPLNLLQSIISISEICLSSHDKHINAQDVSLTMEVFADLGKLIVLFNDICTWCRRGGISCDQQLRKKKQKTENHQLLVPFCR